MVQRETTKKSKDVIFVCLSVDDKCAFRVSSKKPPRPIRNQQLYSHPLIKALLCCCS